ncbi:MAG: hypothetical protein IJ086_16070 [Clostridium sp.]|nr:hypothetical protein [Clostridium sp.]
MKQRKLLKLLKLLKENKNIYCHISSDLSEDNYFYPRIPDATREDENSEINRVCVAKTLEGALTAIPNGAGRLDTYLEQSSYYFKVFIIDTEKLGINKIMSAEELYKNDYVRDAEITGEHWILEEFEVPQEDVFYIRLNEWEERAEDIIPYSIYELSETDEYDGDYEGAYYDVYEDCVPFVCAIEDIDILVEDVKAGEEIEIDLEFVESYLSKDKLKEKFLISNPDIEFIDDEDDDNIIFLAKKDQNISEIMHIDWYYKHCV